MIKTILFVAFGGAIGSVLRYLLSLIINRFWLNSFPIATFITNCLGCILIGILIGYFSKNNIQDSHLKWFLITGFCGGFTTFSAFSLENINLIQNNQTFMAISYIFLSIVVSLLAVALGLFITK